MMGSTGVPIIKMLEASVKGSTGLPKQEIDEASLVIVGRNRNKWMEAVCYFLK